ncbi:MAG: SMI1/KNR4 family protein [Candidatus Bathyarchaeia archaeon]
MGIEGSDRGHLRLNELKPCTEEEMKALEEKLGRSLPAAYREFLLWTGKRVGRGTFMRNEDFFV